MDSQRSGILSTFIMTVPLVIVPAIAIFRPPVPNSSVSSRDLEASDDAFSVDPLSEFDLEAIPTPNRVPEELQVTHNHGNEPEVSPELSEPQESEEETPSPEKNLTQAVLDHHASDPFSTDDASTESETSSDSDPREASEKILLEQLREIGAVRTFWFSVPESSSETGLAVFFRGEHDAMVYRFEAVGASRGDVLRSIHRQVSRWRRKNSAERRNPGKPESGA